MIMANVFGKLFGTDKAVDNLLDKDKGLLVRAGDWVGNLNYTEEDQAEGRERTRTWGLQQLAALEPFKVVQRMLAFGTAGLWIFVALNVVVAIWLDALYPDVLNAEGVVVKSGLHVKESMMQFAMSDYIFWPVLAVFSLYYSGGVVDSIRRKSTN